MKVAIFQFSMFGINTYVVYDPATLCCAIIDPGMSTKQEESAMFNFINKNNLKPVHIINTHLHLDHAVGNSALIKEFDIPVNAGKADEPLGERLQQQAYMFGINEQFKGVEITNYLEEGEIIKIGDGQLKVLNVPGHSKGSVALYDEKDGFVIAGDALFQGSIGRTDLPGGDYNELINSIKSKLLTLPDSTIVYSGHGPTTTIGDEKRNNPYLR